MYIDGWVCRRSTLVLGEAFQRERPITDRQASVFRYGAAGCVAQYPSVPFSGCLLSLLLPTWWKGRDQDFHWNVPLLLQLGDFLESKFENNLAWYTEISFGPSVKRKNFHWWNLQDVPWMEASTTCSILHKTFRRFYSLYPMFVVRYTDRALPCWLRR